MRLQGGRICLEQEGVQLELWRGPTRGEDALLVCCRFGGAAKMWSAGRPVGCCSVPSFLSLLDLKEAAAGSVKLLRWRI